MSKRLSEEQLQKIYNETIDALYRYVFSRCDRQHALAQDITQDTWLRAVSAWQRDGPPTSPIAWLTTVSRNLLLNQQRRRAALPIDHLSASDTLATAQSQSRADGTEATAIVSAAMLRLSQDDAHLLESFHYDGRKMSELATSYGISEKAVEGRLRRARERLRRELEIILKDERGLA